MFENEMNSIRKELQKMAAQYQTVGISNDNDKKLQEAFAQFVGKEWDNPEHRQAVAKIINEQLFDIVQQTDLTNLFERKFYAPNEIPIFYKRGKLRVHWLEHGSDVLTTQQFRTEMQPSTRPLSGAPSYDYDQFKQGRFGDYAEQTRLIAQEFTAKKNKLIFDTLTASMPATGNNNGNYAALTSTGLTKAALDTAIDYVATENAGGVKAVIALYPRLTKIMDLQDKGSYGIELWTEEMKAQFMRIGMIDHYRGAPIIAVKQYIGGDGLISIPPNEVIVLGADDNCFYLERGPYDPLEQVNAINRKWILNLKIDVGFYVFNSEKNYRIKLSGYVG